MIAMAKAARSRDATTASRQHSSLAILFVFFTAWSSVFERGGTVAMAHPPRHSDNILSGGSSNPSEALSRAVSLGKRAQMLRAESAASHVEHRHHHGGQLKGILEGPGSLVRVVYADRLDVELEAMESALVVFADPTSKISRRVDDEVTRAAKLLRKEGVRVVKIDVGHERNEGVADRFGVKIVPSFKFFVGYGFRRNRLPSGSKGGNTSADLCSKAGADAAGCAFESPLLPYVGRRSAEDFHAFMVEQKRRQASARQQEQPESTVSEKHSSNSEFGLGNDVSIDPVHRTKRRTLPNETAQSERRARVQAGKRAAAVSLAHSLSRQLEALRQKFTKLARDASRGGMAEASALLPKLTQVREQLQQNMDEVRFADDSAALVGDDSLGANRGSPRAYLLPRYQSLAQHLDKLIAKAEEDQRIREISAMTGMSDAESADVLRRERQRQRGKVRRRNREGSANKAEPVVEDATPAEAFVSDDSENEASPANNRARQNQAQNEGRGATGESKSEDSSGRAGAGLSGWPAHTSIDGTASSTDRDQEIARLREQLRLQEAELESYGQHGRRQAPRTPESTKAAGRAPANGVPASEVGSVRMLKHHSYIEL